MSTTTSSAAKVTATLVGAAHATITTTLGAVPTPSAAAASIFDPSHPNPVKYDSSNPLVLFIVQAFIIVTLSRVLHFFLRYLRQPRVISEVVAGILVGPSAFGRIPDFTSSIFPAPSIPLLNLVANLGLCLFLFIVGIECDFSLMRHNARLSSSISGIGLIVPFATGAGVSKVIFDEFVDADKVDYGTFLLFIGTAMAITAFPVLARILTDENLLKNHVGVIVLAAGVGNDIVGWVLLALAIALANSTSGLIVLYILLTSLGWILVLYAAGRPLLHWVGRKTRSFDGKGPSQTMTAFVLFLTLTSAWITDRIGIHAIFGAFLVGLVVPKEIRASLTEKIEDLVTVLLLPLYFALSGLKTDLGLLNDGSIWGYTVLVIVLAFVSKFVACGGVAKAFGMTWRESGAAGSLMACKGLVELIVLNIGLSAGILNNQVFAMFVVMALVTTFATTPLTLAFYPEWYRVQMDRQRRGLPSLPAPGAGEGPFADEAKPRTRLAVVVETIEHLPPVMAFLRLVAPPAQFGEAVAALPALVKSGVKAVEVEKRASIDKMDLSAEDATPSPSSANASTSHPTLSALRLLELTDRTSTLLRSATSERALLAADALAHVLRAVAAGVAVPLRRVGLVLAAPEAYARTVAEFVEEEQAELVLVPWALPAPGASKDSEDAGTGKEAGVTVSNPLEALFGGMEGAGSGASVGVQGAAGYAALVRRVFAESPADVALLLDRPSSFPSSLAPSAQAGRAHLFLAFHGGSDDRLALALVAQLVAAHPGLTATVVRVVRAPEPTQDDREVLELGLKESNTAEGTEPLASPAITREDQPLFTLHGSSQAQGQGHGITGLGADTVYATTLGASGTGAGGAAAAVQSETADEALLARLFSAPAGTTSSDESAVLPAAARARIAFSTAASAQPLRFALARLEATRLAAARAGVPLTVFVGRGRRDAPSHAGELAGLMKTKAERVRQSVVVSSEVRRALGDHAAAVVLEMESPVAGVGAGAGGAGEERVVVLQRRGKGGRVDA
ncbi:hypothetical protein JCM10207_007081 [Rhodosporidiobolus poonsookiae]